jgi:hypothetical protein
MFEFQHTLEILDEVPQNYRALYSKGDDGKFTLDADLAKRLDVSGLTSALDKERKANKASGGLLAGWKALGETPEAVQERLQELTTAATKGTEGQKVWDKLKADLESGHQKVLQAKDLVLKGMQTSLEKYLIDSAATTAILTAKGSATLLLPHVRQNVRVFEEKGEHVVRVVDSDGDPRGDGKGGFMTIADFITEMRSSADFSRAFEPSGNTGGGKPAGSSKSGSGAGRDTSELSPVQRIASGLKKGQLTHASSNQ